jgi:hypothetical protein
MLAGSSFSRGADRVDERGRRKPAVLAIPVVIGAAEQHLVHVRRADLRRGVRVRHAPQHVLRIDPGFLLKILHHAVVERRREEAQVARDEIELALARVERRHPVIDVVVHAGRLPRLVPGEPLRGLRRDVDLDRRRAEPCPGWPPAGRGSFLRQREAGCAEDEHASQREMSNRSSHDGAACLRSEPFHRLPGTERRAKGFGRLILSWPAGRSTPRSRKMRA